MNLSDKLISISLPVKFRQVGKANESGSTAKAWLAIGT